VIPRPHPPLATWQRENTALSILGVWGKWTISDYSQMHTGNSDTGRMHNVQNGASVFGIFDGLLLTESLENKEHI
jgi:hypothetical protein